MTHFGTWQAGVALTTAAEHQSDNPTIWGIGIAALAVFGFVNRKRFVQSTPMVRRDLRAGGDGGFHYLYAMAFAIFAFAIVFIIGCWMIGAGLTGHY